MIYLGDELEVKRHIDCDWLLEKEEGVYYCCDTRSPHRGQALTKDDSLKEACPFFHRKKNSTDQVSSLKF